MTPGRRHVQFYAVPSLVVSPDVCRLFDKVETDGRTLVFDGGRAGMERLCLRRLDELQATPLAGAERAISPFFLPTGNDWIRQDARADRTGPRPKDARRLRRFAPEFFGIACSAGLPRLSHGEEE
ncbi:MAG TPA: hypothetical protein VNH18_34400 [Bryobacteraceae bacterium]|nr:hypothetical protein [Bryobacteraceae bacterium]